jgi:hypothetical protein
MAGHRSRRIFLITFVDAVCYWGSPAVSLQIRQAAGKKPVLPVLVIFPYLPMTYIFNNQTIFFEKLHISNDKDLGFVRGRKITLDRVGRNFILLKILYLGGNLRVFLILQESAGHVKVRPSNGKLIGIRYLLKFIHPFHFIHRRAADGQYRQQNYKPFEIYHGKPPIVIV